MSEYWCRASPAQLAEKGVLAAAASGEVAEGLTPDEPVSD